MNGTITNWPPAASAASAAALASSDSRAMVNTMPGSTTPEVRGRRGRFWAPADRLVPVVSVVSSVFSSIDPPGVASIWLSRG